MKKGDIIQAIIINIDLDRIDRKGLNIFEVIAEEVVHGADATVVGVDSWNKNAEKENKLPYSERPRENM
ncbi:MAG: hypothetical protein P1P59_04195 [Treponemataceae bacterium]